MDISTVRNNLANEVYKTPLEFAEHMRLIWKNAIAYNSAKDNPVHIAARECARMFEEKYRAAVGTFSNSNRKRLNPVVKKKGPGDYGSGMRFFDQNTAGAFAAAAAAVAASKGEGLRQLLPLKRKMLGLHLPTLFYLQTVVWYRCRKCR